MSWRPGGSATPRWKWRRRKSSPKAIVRAAGPQKKWVYAQDTSVNTSGVGLGRVLTAVLLASDYEDNQGQQRERVMLDQFSMKAEHFMTPVASISTRVTVMCALFTADLETAAELASQAIDPFIQPALWEEFDVQLLRTWGYVLECNGTNATQSQSVFGGTSARYVSKAYNLKLRMREPMGLYLWTVFRGVGTGQSSTLEPAFRIKMRSW